MWQLNVIPKNKFYRFGGGLQFDLELKEKEKAQHLQQSPEP
jgi:hypothetical protein